MSLFHFLNDPYPSLLPTDSIFSINYISLKNILQSFRQDFHQKIALVHQPPLLVVSIYFSALLEEMVREQEYDLYDRKQIPIPTPKFVVFYNGLDQRPAKEVMRLSDAYEHQENQYSMDLECIAYNINPGYNKDIQRDSRVLSGYTAFVEKVRTYAETDNLEDAVERAVEECICEDILTEFFRERRSEVIKMAALDFTFERREQLIRRDSLEEGIEIGYSQGEEAGYTRGETSKFVTLVCRKLQKKKTAEVIADELEEDPETVEKICQIAKNFAPEYDIQEICKALQTGN